MAAAIADLDAVYRSQVSDNDHEYVKKRRHIGYAEFIL
jgi:hypothetical protein